MIQCGKTDPHGPVEFIPKQFPLKTVRVAVLKRIFFLLLSDTVLLKVI